ncbi:MAG TPA: M20/M25/M40 family metallo-hydrolase [Telluria sp.]
MRKTIACMLALATAGLVGTAAADELSPVEQQIVAAIQSHSPQALDLLKQSVLINSGTMNAPGVRAVGQLFREQFDALGFQTRWIEMPPEMKRAGHLLATHEGKQGKRLLLLGHIDTVFEPGSAAPLWEPQGGGPDARVRGQGVSDMKGGDVIVIEALRALKQVGALDNTNIAVMFTGDEEEAGYPRTISRADMQAIAKHSDVALSFEGSIIDKDGLATATVGRRATASFELKVAGRQGHSMGVFGVNGDGAIYEAARILDTFRQQVAEPGLTFNPGLIVGGTEVGIDAGQTHGTAFGKTNVIANSVMVKSDLRYLDYAQRDRAQARMREIVAHNLPGTSASISFEDSYPPMAVTPGNLKVLELYSHASQDAGLGPIGAVPAEARGAGDIQFVAPLVDSLDGLGASGHGAHSPNEDLDVGSIQRGAIRAAILIYRLTR